MSTSSKQSNISKRIPPKLLTLWACVAAFGVYTCMYSLRKGITATTFAGMEFWGVSYKILLIMAQVFGYAMSKLIGIRVVSEAKLQQRGWYIAVLAGLAGLSLWLFAIVPAPYNILFLFLNGLPLGMIYGLVLGFLEGRRQTDVLVAALTASFIFASGFVKTVGLSVLSWGVNEYYMPLVTALLFMPFMVLFLFLLIKLPKPSAEDIALRTERLPMNKERRRDFVRLFLPGIVLFIFGYVLLTVLRDFRDNFGPEVLKELGVTNAGVFTRIETPIAVLILILISSLAQIKDNFQAFKWVNIITFGGVLLAIGCTWLFQLGLLDPITWMLVVGAGMYMGYVPANGIYFDRLMATFKYPGTVGFIVTMADYYGYMGSVVLLLYKNFGQANIKYSTFLIYAVYIVLGIYGVSMSFAYFYFRGEVKKRQDEKELDTQIEMRAEV
jgi:hypothetical protein